MLAEWSAVHGICQVTKPGKDSRLAPPSCTLNSASLLDDAGAIWAQTCLNIFAYTSLISWDRAMPVSMYNPLSSIRMSSEHLILLINKSQLPPKHPYTPHPGLQVTPTSWAPVHSPYPGQFIPPIFLSPGHSSQSGF